MRSNIVPVIENTNFQDQLYRMVLPFPYSARAGQFVMVQKENSKYLLARPISVCDVVDDQLILIYQVVGRGTDELSKLKPADKVVLTGAIGQGFPTDLYSSGQKIALVGGGVGTAPLVKTAKVLKEKGVVVNAYIAFRDKSMLRDQLEAVCDEVIVCTESGNEGSKGYATDCLNPADYDAVFCCGPTPMMKSVVELCKKSSTKVYVSLENRMACGIGVCLVCTCANHQGENKRTCLDGPVFDGLEVNFDA